MDQIIQEANAPAATAWGYSGAAWNAISFGLSDGISHAVQMLWPQPDDHILDIGTGTGWAARLAAGTGATVTGIDFSASMIEAARDLSGHLSDRLDFRVAEAESLPFPDASFDGIVSTYGVMFTADPDAAIAEMARVLRPGGRMVLATWAADGSYIPSFFELLVRYNDAPPPETSPMVWGDPDWLHDKFDRHFDIHLEPRVTTLYAPDPESVWKKYIAGFGPLILVAENLPEERRANLRDAFLDLHEAYRTGPGLRIDRHALLVHGVRR